MSRILIIRDKSDINSVIGHLQLPDNKDFDYAMIHRKNDDIYKCFKFGVWNCTFCKTCAKYLCTDYGTISRHCSILHQNLEKKEEIIQKKILKFVLLNNIYFSIVENPDFTDLFPFDIMTRRTVTNYLGTISIKVREKIKMILSKLDYVTIYFDEWSKFQHNFLGVTVSTHDSIFLLDLIVPDDVERTREVISHYVNVSIEYYQISKKIAFQCSDCGSNVLSVCENIDWFPCCNHILNRCIEDTLKVLPIAKSLAKRLASLRNSQKFKRFLLLNSTNYSTFPNYCKTRWYSLADIFSRTKEIREIIENYQKYLSKSGKVTLKKDIEFFTINDFTLIDTRHPEKSTGYLPSRIE